MSLWKELELSLCEDMKLSREGESDLRLEGLGIQTDFKNLPAGIIDPLVKLSTGGIRETDLTNLAVAQAGASSLIHLYHLLMQLSARGALCYTLRPDGQALATLVPLAAGHPVKPDLARRDQRYTLSRFAYMHKDGERIRLESPLGHGALLLHDWRGCAWISALCRPHNCAALTEIIPSLDEETALVFLNLLLNAHAVSTTEAQGSGPEDLSTPLGWWEFHDLLFHTRSRGGRHHNPYGGTYHLKGIAPPPPLLKPDMMHQAIPLFKPDLDRLKLTDVPCAAVFEGRRSIRDYDDEQPITLRQLGEFLYRSARIQQVLKTPEDDMDYSYRPHPGGGAIHELEIYPVVGRCDGLKPGIYHYNPLDHQLSVVCYRNQKVDTLLYHAWQTADKRSQPNIYFAITARFQRLQWKYQSVVYAIILKNVGALYQTMYLVATAMGLAPCALGGGNSDLFMQATGLDYYTESTVGEFILGSKKK